MPEPYTRYGDFRTALSADIDSIANVDISRAYVCDSGPAFTPFIGTGNLTTSTGTPTTATTDPCFVNADGTPQAYCKLDPGDVLTCSGGGSNLETMVSAWVRLDALPAADARIMSCLQPTVGGFDGFGVNTSGQFFCQNGTTVQGTDATVRTLGLWYWLLKINDASGGGTGTWLYVNGVRVLSLGGAGGTKNAPGLVGDANFDGAVAYCFFGRGTTSLTDAGVAAAYRRGVTKLYQRALAL